MCIVIHHDQETHLLFDYILIGAHALQIGHSKFSITAELIVEMLFMLPFVNNAV